MGGSSGGFYDSSLAVLRVRALSAPALALQAAAAGALRATGDARSTLTAAVVANGVNLALDVALVRGAHTASSMSACLEEHDIAIVVHFLLNRVEGGPSLIADRVHKAARLLLSVTREKVVDSLH